MRKVVRIPVLHGKAYKQACCAAMKLGGQYAVPCIKGCAFLLCHSGAIKVFHFGADCVRNIPARILQKVHQIIGQRSLGGVLEIQNADLSSFRQKHQVSGMKIAMYKTFGAGRQSGLDLFP